MRSRMNAAVFEGVGKLVVKEVDSPAIKEEDDLICEVELCSVCGTDVHIMEVPPGYTATPGTILGHELVGRIVEAGAGVRTLKVGRPGRGQPQQLLRGLPLLPARTFPTSARTSSRWASAPTGDLPSTCACPNGWPTASRMP